MIFLGMGLRLLTLGILISFLSCAVPAKKDSGNSTSPGGSVPNIGEAAFPHNTTWSKGEIHGSWVVRNGSDHCFKCHNAKLDQGKAPACNSCHKHPDGWMHQHGSVLIENGKEKCTHCHGGDFTGSFSGVSCYQSNCHKGNSYPHSANFKEGVVHGLLAYGDRKKECANCHGENYEGRNKVPSCYDCHDFPHVDPKWMNVEPKTKNPTLRGDNFHGDRFIRFSMEGRQEECTRCHGPAFDNFEPGKGRCVTCHANGITHQNTPDKLWKSGMSHGKFFSDNGFKSIDTSIRCWDCHGAPVPFTPSQTVEERKLQSDCYRCHSSYPHTEWNAEPWEPVETNTCGYRNSINAKAHMFYLSGNPLLVDGTIQATCGGETAGSCHSTGNRAYDSGNPMPRCSYCHQSGPIRPSLPDCDPPPGNQQNPGDPATLQITAALYNPQASTRIWRVTVTFSEPMQRDTITKPGALTVRLVNGADPVLGIVTCSEDWCQTATWLSNDLLDFDTEYEVIVTMAVKDWGGAALARDVHWNFRTPSQDLTPPTITRTNPNSKGTISLGQYVVVYFSEPMLQSTFTDNADAIRIYRRSDHTQVQDDKTKCYYASDCSIIRTRPVGLAYDTEYEAIVSSTVKDLEGNPLGSDYTWTFFTLPPPDEEE